MGNSAETRMNREANGARVLGTQGERALARAAMQRGMICHACGGPVQDGFEYVRLEAAFDPREGLVVNRHVLVLCGGEDCAEANTQARVDYEFRRPALWAPLGSAGEDPDAA